MHRTHAQGEYIYKSNNTRQRIERPLLIRFLIPHHPSRTKNKKIKIKNRIITVAMKLG